jgi:glutathione S-transferase
MTMWAIWAMTDCEPHTLPILYHRVARPAHERDPAIADAAIQALKRPFRVLESALAEGDSHLVGARFTVADLNTAEVIRYAQGAPELFAEYPRVAEWLDSCQARPAFKAMMAARNAEPA